MEQAFFEQAVLAAIRQVPKEQRLAILKIVQTLVWELKEPEPQDGKRPYSVEQHREIRKLTATIRGSLAATISVERDERG